MTHRFAGNRVLEKIGQGPRRSAGILLAILLISLVALGLAQGQQVVHRNGFESNIPAWTKGPADVPYREVVHDVTDQTAHSGQYSEHLQLVAETGTFIHYIYPTGRAPLTEEFSVSLWIKANRPGVQLQARMVLPRERNAANLSEPVTTMLRGDQYQLAGRWQRLELRRPVKLAKEQQQLLRAELKRDIDMTDAYVDRLILNVYGGPGQTEIWIDDLEAGPVLEAVQVQPPAGPVTAQPKNGNPAIAPRPPVQGRAAVVEVNQDRLLVNNKRFFFRGVRPLGMPLKSLRDVGFNTVWLDAAVPGQIEEAVNLGFWIGATLPVGTGSQPTAAAALEQPMAQYQQGDAILFWYLGGGRTLEDAPQVAKAAQAVRTIDPQRPLATDVWDGFLPYSRHLDLIGTHRWPLMTTLELSQYRDWLNQRRLLARPGTFLWTWIQTHTPDWFALLLNERNAGGTDNLARTAGPQPEQIRLLTYAALSAGSRGLGYWSDGRLTDSEQRDRLLTLALLNQELQMLEPLLLSMVESPGWIETSIPEVKAAVLRTEHGILVLPIWLGKGSQFVPGQSAAVKLSMVVPQVPIGSQAWEISPAEVHSLRSERVPGGTKVTVPEFGLTSAILFTSDLGPNGMIIRFQEQVRRTRRDAAQWTTELAQVEMDKVLRVEAELEQAGHGLPDGRALQDNARARLQTAQGYLNNGDYRQAYAEAQRALRPLRILMRAQWESAIREFDTPVASPYAVSYFSLPQHWELVRELRQAVVGPNVLPDGDFETTPDRPTATWTPQEGTLDEVELSARRVTDEPREGKLCLQLEIKPKNPQLPPAALERTFMAINSPAVQLPPGTLVRISGWMRIPRTIAASVDGAMMYDNSGGEPLALRLSERSPWRKFTFYRRVPSSGSLNVTLALTGIGTVYFDDVRMEQLVQGNPNAGPAR